MDKFIIAVSFGMGWFDQHVIDGVVNGVGKGTTVARRLAPGLQTGRIPSYALAVAGAGDHRLLGRLLRDLVTNLLTARPLWT